MKKLVLLAVFALSLFATARPTDQRWNPLPMCDPCPEIR